MKKLRYAMLALTIVPFSAYSQDGWFGIGDEEQGQQQERQQEQDKQEQTEVESEEVIERQEIDTTGQKNIGNTEVEQQQQEVKFKETERVTKELIKSQQIPTVQVTRTYADINKMDKKDFQAIGFDEQSSQKIVQTRQQQGEFQSVEDLSQVQGIDQAQLSQVKNDLGTAKMQAQEEPKKQSQEESQQEPQNDAL